MQCQPRNSNKEVVKMKPKQNNVHFIELSLKESNISTQGQMVPDLVLMSSYAVLYIFIDKTRYFFYVDIDSVIPYVK